MDVPGAIIAGKYRLVSVAGTGGMAAVWRAVQHGAAGFERPVAIKRVKEEIAYDEQFVELFVEEARVGSQLVHPNIVQVHDFGEDRGRYFLVMEWIEGLTLARYLEGLRQQGSLPPWHLVAGIAAEALTGLAAAHEKLDAYGNPTPVYHRDVTPQNILLSVQGLVKLTDFGLARATDRARMTAPEVIKGKVGYLAPEMTQTAQPTPRTDIYALGVVLWQALSGRKLFDGKDDIDVFVAASRGDVPPLMDLRPDLPRELAAIVERALARDPDDRFDSAAQMERVIRKLLRAADVWADPRAIGPSVAEAKRVLEGS